MSRTLLSGSSSTCVAIDPLEQIGPRAATGVACRSELYVLTRHGESTLNSENRINGDRGFPLPSRRRDEREARLLGQQVAHLRLDLCICTRFTRTRETAEIALRGRDVPIEVEPLLDDIDVGTSKESRSRTTGPGSASTPAGIRSLAGESLDAAAERYAQAFRKLLRTAARRRCSW